MQDAVLREGGVTTDWFVISAPVGPGPAFRHIGEPFKATKGKRVELRLQRLDRDWLRVTTGTTTP